MSDKRWKIKKGVYFGNSDAYRWLRRHHPDIEAFLRAKCGSFSYVVQEIAKDGIKGTKGQELCYSTLLGIWRRVRRDVAQEVGEAAPPVLAPATTSPTPDLVAKTVPSPVLPAAQTIPSHAPVAHVPAMAHASSNGPAAGILAEPIDDQVSGALVSQGDASLYLGGDGELTDEEVEQRIEQMRLEFRHEDRFLHGFLTKEKSS